MPCRFSSAPGSGEGAGGVQAEAAGPAPQGVRPRSPGASGSRTVILRGFGALALSSALLTAPSCAVDRAPAIRPSPDLGSEEVGRTEEVGGRVDGDSPDGSSADAEVELPAEPPRVDRIDIVELIDLPLARSINIMAAEPLTLTTTALCADADGEELAGVGVSDPVEYMYGDRLYYEQFVFGLAFGAECELTIEATSPLGVSAVLTDTFDSPPPDDFPALDLLVSSESRQPGWTLFDLMERRGNRGWVVLLDDRDRPRWIARSSSRYEDVHVTSLGALHTSGVTPWSGAPPLSLTGLDEVDLHAVEASPFNDGAWFQIVVDETCGGQAYLVETRGTERLGSFCPADWFEEPSEGGDWTHLNGFDFLGPSGHLVLSFRDLEGGTLVGVHWPTQRPSWIALGGEVFGEQHAPEVQPNGNILLFDNTYDGVSSAVEIALTIDANRKVATATEVWRFVDPLARHQGMYGDADRQPNGNTLISFGAPDGNAEPVLLEVTAAGEIVFDLRGPRGWTTYRAERFTCPNSPSLGPWECPSLEPPRVLR
jgi:hypothetical protein